MSTAKGVALITGSAQGLGRCIALRLARDGFDIGLNDVPSKCDELRAVADEIVKIGQKVHLVPADVSVEDEVEGMVEDVVKELGGLDVMVANAGVGSLSLLVDTAVDKWEQVMAVNARGPFLCYKYAARQMIKQGRGGRIIGASSTAGKTGFRGACAYSASKFAVRGLTQTAALELGPYNITVNSYAPGIIKTAMTASIFDTSDGGPAARSELFKLWRNIPSKQAIKYDCQPDDIASIVSYLASKEAHFITGKSQWLISFSGYLLNLFGFRPGQSFTVDGGIVLS